MNAPVLVPTEGEMDPLAIAQKELAAKDFAGRIEAIRVRLYGQTRVEK